MNLFLLVLLIAFITIDFHPVKTSKLDRESSVEVFFVKRAGENPDGKGKGKASRNAGHLTIKTDNSLKRMTGHALKHVGNVLSCTSGVDCSPSHSPHPRISESHSSKKIEHTSSVTPPRSPNRQSQSVSTGKGKAAAEPSHHSRKPSISRLTSMDEKAVKLAKDIFGPTESVTKQSDLSQGKSKHTLEGHRNAYHLASKLFGPTSGTSSNPYRAKKPEKLVPKNKDEYKENE